MKIRVGLNFNPVSFFFSLFLRISLSLKFKTTKIIRRVARLIFVSIVNRKQRDYITEILPKQKKTDF